MLPQVSATGALRIQTTWTHATAAAAEAQVVATGTVDNQATSENLKRRLEWEATVDAELFGRP